jgi:hypothetical protein
VQNGAALTGRVSNLSVTIGVVEHAYCRAELRDAVVNRRAPAASRSVAV